MDKAENGFFRGGDALFLLEEDEEDEEEDEEEEENLFGRTRSENWDCDTRFLGGGLVVGGRGVVSRFL